MAFSCSAHAVFLLSELLISFFPALHFTFPRYFSRSYVFPSSENPAFFHLFFTFLFLNLLLFLPATRTRKKREKTISQFKMYTRTTDILSCSNRIKYRISNFRQSTFAKRKTLSSFSQKSLLQRIYLRLPVIIFEISLLSRCLCYTNPTFRFSV